MDIVYVIVRNTIYLRHDGRYIGEESDVRGVCESTESCSKRVSEIIEGHYISVNENCKRYFDGRFVDSEGNGRLDVIADYITDRHKRFLRYYDDGYSMITELEIQEFKVI